MTGITVNQRTISRIYKKHGIKHAKPHYHFWRNKTKEEEQERIIFADELAEFIKDGRDIVYFDETTSNIWEKRTKVCLNPC